MSKASWKKKIVKAMEAVGTYSPSFDVAIDSLAELQHKKDVANKKFEESGGNPVAFYNDGKTQGMNTYLKVWTELNSQSIKLMTELGITASGLKRINATELSNKKPLSKLDEALLSLANG